MKLQSLRNNQEVCNESISRKLEDLLAVRGAIRSVTIISAYTDVASISGLLKFVRERADSRTSPKLRIFIDRAASRFSSDPDVRRDLVKLQRRIERSCEADSGIFLVQSGPLFHSKAYLIESNNYARMLVGSMNLTRKGMAENEELMLISDIDFAKKSPDARLLAWLRQYAMWLAGNSQVVSGSLKPSHPASMRQLLLDGKLYYEAKEQNPFRFKLFLPSEVARQRADLDHLLESSISDTISLDTLITAPEGFGLGLELPVIATTKSRWKKYCVETCFGYWNPIHQSDGLRKSLRKRSAMRRRYFDRIYQIMVEQPTELCAMFLALCARITKVAELGVADWRYADLRVAEESWHAWSEMMKEKMGNKSYREKLVLGVQSAPSPDVWGDPLAADEFEESFCESIIYYWSKEYTKETSNIIAQAVAANLGHGATAGEQGPYGLQLEIVQWMKSHVSSIFET